jgi:hypothetical protein
MEQPPNNTSEEKGRHEIEISLIDDREPIVPEHPIDRTERKEKMRAIVHANSVHGIQTQHITELQYCDPAFHDFMESPNNRINLKDVIQGAEGKKETQTTLAKR